MLTIKGLCLIVKCENLPSSFLLAGYSGYKALSDIPYILFRLKEIKKNEAISLREHACNSCLDANELSFFSQITANDFTFITGDQT
jgi:hypothetical protein